MSLQIEVKSTSVTGNTKATGLTTTFNLKCWLETANKEIDDPVIDQSFSRHVKVGIEGKTADELLTRTVKIIKSEMQDIVNKYKREQELLASARLETARAWLETTLEG